VLEKGMKQHPNLLSAHLCKARIFIETGNLDEAGTILQRIIDQKPENLLARKLMAFVHLKRDEPEEGLEQLDRIKEIEPDHKVPQALHSKLLAARESLGGISESQQLILTTLEGWLKNAEKMQGKVSA
jgi:tetratricopeptide (TPR) repeat protein